MFDRTITVLSPAWAVDRYGDAVTDWDNATRTPMRDVDIQPIDTAERHEADRTPVVTRWRVTTRPAWPIPAVASTDRIEHAGQLFEVVGQPQVWTDPITGTPSFIAFDITRITG